MSAGSWVPLADAIREVIEWIDVGVRLPDDDITVLISMPESDEPVWLGWHADDQWYAADGTEVDGVTAWADVPRGVIP